MKRIIFLAILVGLIYQGKSFWGPGQSSSITFASDGTVLFPWWSYKVVAEQGEDISGEYVVIGASPPQMGLPGGSLTVIPQAESERLTRQYGNYRRCANPGSKVAMARAIHMLILTDNPDMPELLGDTKKLLFQSAMFRLQIDGFKLDVIDYTTEYQGQGNIEQHDFHNQDELFYISSVRIISETLQ